MTTAATAATAFSITGPSSINEGDFAQVRIKFPEPTFALTASDQYFIEMIQTGGAGREELVRRFGVEFGVDHTDKLLSIVNLPKSINYTLSGIDPARIQASSSLNPAKLSGTLTPWNADIILIVKENYQFDGPTTATINIGNGSYTFDIKINDTSTTIPVLSVQSTNYDEGSSAIFVLKNAKASTSYFYEVERSTPIDYNDINFGNFGSWIQTDSKGEAVIRVGILNDLRTEGSETLRFNINVGGLKLAASTLINDTSITPLTPSNPTPPAAPQPTLPVKNSPIKLSANTSVNEGSVFSINIDTSQIVSTDPVVIIPYTLSGISAEDVSRVFLMGGGSADQLTNTFSGEIGIGLAFGLRAQVSISFLARSDYLTEGPETLVFSAGGQSISIVINDTSTGTSTIPTTPIQPIVTQPIPPAPSTPTFTTSNSISMPTGKLAVSSTSANDLITGNTATNVVDTVAYQGSIKDYKVAISSNGNYSVIDSASSRDGSDLVVNVERLKFSPDATTGANRIALDLDPVQASGKAVLLIGAVLPGKLALAPDKYQLMGTVIDLFDQGYSLQALSGALLRLPIWDILTGKPNPSNADIATYLVNNVYGVTSQSSNLGADLARSLAIQSMNAETPTTQGTYLATLAASTASQSHIDLVGIQSTGLVYLG
jgi:hypothetical protein